MAWPQKTRGSLKKTCFKIPPRPPGCSWRASRSLMLVLQQQTQTSATLGFIKARFTSWLLIDLSWADSVRRSVIIATPRCLFKKEEGNTHTHTHISLLRCPDKPFQFSAPLHSSVAIPHSPERLERALHAGTCSSERSRPLQRPTLGVESRALHLPCCRRAPSCPSPSLRSLPPDWRLEIRNGLSWRPPLSTLPFFSSLTPAPPPRTFRAENRRDQWAAADGRGERLDTAVSIHHSRACTSFHLPSGRAGW